MASIRRKMRIDGNSETAQIASRLLNSLPAATFEMETFLRLAGIVATRRIPTAAMECVHRPRLLINPDFVSKHCKRDEHLFLLVMHELWHVLLAHTSLYPRMTEAHNIAFDAIINAGLIRQFKTPAYMGFFDAINPPDQFPHMLLRPPMGWPDAPEYPDVGPVGTQRIIQQLYPPPGAPPRPLPFYQEILNLILEDKLEKGELYVVKPVLLGDHDSDQETMLSNVFFNDVIDQMTEKWPAMPPGLQGRGFGQQVNPWKVRLTASSEQMRRVFSSVLLRCLGPHPGGHVRRTKMPVPGISGTSVLPNGKDRLAPARKLLGAPKTLWAQPGDVKACVPERPSRAYVYLDVSGSMARTIHYLLHLMIPYVANRRAEIFQFSTKVVPMQLDLLRKGEMTTTGGTDIRCVMRHLLEAGPTVRRALILTDGYTGVPTPDQIAGLNERNLKVHVVLPGESPYDHDLKDMAASVTILPPLRRSPLDL